MKIDIGKKFKVMLLIVCLLIAFSPNVLSQQLSFDSLSTFSSGYDDFLTNQSIQIWFDDTLDFFTLDTCPSCDLALSWAP